jgi:hypothetical protein
VAVTIQGEVIPFLHATPRTAVFRAAPVPEAPEGGGGGGGAWEAELLLGSSVPFTLEAASLRVEGRETPLVVAASRPAGYAAEHFRLAAPAGHADRGARGKILVRVRAAQAGAPYVLEVPAVLGAPRKESSP